MVQQERREQLLDQLRIVLGVALVVLVLWVFALEYDQSGATLELITETLENLITGLEAIEEGLS